MLKPYKKLSSEVVVDTKFVKFMKDRFESGTGVQGDYYYMHRNDCVHAVGVDLDNNFILVRRYRYPIHMFVIDVAGGVADDGEDIQVAAEREFFEETGYKGTKVIPLGKCAGEPGKGDYFIYEYLITGCEKVTDERGEGGIEETEIVKIPIGEVWRYIRENKIMGAQSISTVTKAMLKWEEMG